MNVWSSSLPGVVIALIGGVVAVWQARVGVRPAEQEGFRADFQAIVKEVREDNEKLEAKVVSLEVKIEEQTIEMRALANYTRLLIRELRDRNLQVPVYVPPPDLTKHLT
jgi:hypothetical protein